jgi:hypothetical protein
MRRFQSPVWLELNVVWLELSVALLPVLHASTAGLCFGLAQYMPPCTQRCDVLLHFTVAHCLAAALRATD